MTRFKTVSIPLDLKLPDWAIKSLSEEASRNGFQIEALIKLWLIERLDTVSIPLPR